MLQPDSTLQTLTLGALKDQLSNLLTKLRGEQYVSTEEGLESLLEQLEALLKQPDNVNSNDVKYRLQLEFGAEAKVRLEEIRKDARVSSYAETIRNALCLYGWLIEQRKAGYEIGLIRDKEPIRVIELSPLIRDGS